MHCVKPCAPKYPPVNSSTSTSVVGNLISFEPTNVATAWDTLLIIPEMDALEILKVFGIFLQQPSSLI